MNLKSVLYGQHEGKLVQFPRAVLSSLGGSVLDYITTIVFVEFTIISVFWSGTIGMVTGLIFVYFAGRFWIYPPVPGSAVKIDAVLFVIIAVAGAGINMLVMSLGFKFLHIHYLIVKFCASILMFTWNFFMRRLVNRRLRKVR